MRTLEPPNRLRLGLMGIVSVALVTAVGQTFTQAPQLFARPSYFGQFADSGGINVGDKVRIAGLDVGQVQAIDLDGDHVKMKFSLGGNTIGTDSRLAIKTDTVLGRKILEVEPRGSQKLKAGAELPLGASTSPYQIYDAFLDATKAAAGWDVKTVKDSLKVLVETVDETSPHLSAALDGVGRFADTIGKRDEQIDHLLTQANQVATVLGDRADQINALFLHAQTLLAAFNQRSAAIDALLGNVTRFGVQVRGLINDNPNLNHVLQQLSDVSDLLVKRKDDLQDLFMQFAKLYPILNDAVASGPYFKVSALNILPYWVLQPFVDAAFKKRGISPEEFWRNAGLPEFRYPDPNGTRQANGAPPPAPTVLEGTPEHPGPAVAPGSPCSYAPAAGVFPTPGNPLPCAGVNQNMGPFGPGGPFPDSLPDVLTSPPNPDGLPASPGISMGGRPGETPPLLPGTPVPLPPNAPPGARTEPLGPLPGPLPANPGAAPPPPPMAPGPPAPPGPGNQLPAPFITPGEGGNSQPGGGGGSLEGR